MKNSLLFFFIVISIISANAQNSLSFKSREVVVTWTDQQQHKQKQFLNTVTDSGMYVSAMPLYSMGHVSNKAGDLWIPYEQIQQISVRKRKALQQGVLVWGLGGAVLGGVIGAVTYKDPGPNAFLDFGVGFDIMAGAGAGLAAGSAIGILTTLAKIKTRKIDGDSVKYKAYYQYMVQQLTKKSDNPGSQ